MLDPAVLDPATTSLAASFSLQFTTCLLPMLAEPLAPPLGYHVRQVHGPRSHVHVASRGCWADFQNGLAGDHFRAGCAERGQGLL